MRILPLHARVLALLLPALLLAGCGDGVTTAGSGATIIPPILIGTASSLPGAQLGMFYSNQFQFSGGSSPYTVSMTGGTLPPGLSLSSPGNLSGTPNTLGTYSFNYIVKDSSATQLSATGSATVTVSGVVVQVNTAQTLAVVPATGYGLHTSAYDTSLADTAALPALLKNTGVAMLRYPGGSYSDNYHWAQYAMTPIAASDPGACGIISNGYLAPGSDFGAFVRTMQASGAQGIITVNYGSSVANSLGTVSTSTYQTPTCSDPNTYGQPQEAAAWVAYSNGSPSNTQSIGIDAAGFDWKTVGYWATMRAAKPLPVDDGFNFLRLGLTNPIGIKYWEIGNEIYYNGYETESVESDRHAPYVYPDGYSATAVANPRVGDARLSPAAYGTNAIGYILAMKAVDPTIKIGVVTSNGIDPVPSTFNPAVLGAVCGGTNFDFAVIHYYPGTYNGVTAAQMLSSPQGDLVPMVANLKKQLAQYCPSNAANMQVFVTETGPNGTILPGTPAAVEGLYAAHDTLTSLEAGASNIEWLELHNGTYLAEGTEATGPAYYGLELAHMLAGVGDALVATTSTSSSVVVHASLKANGQKGVMLVNSDPANAVAVQVSVSGSTLGATASQYTYGINTVQGSPTLAAATVSVANGNTVYVMVQPYSATELIIP
ncbi:hypothetical protein SAMN05421770_101351 [Granulicella rosea]|uniref:Alpha-L-arabinofuranosidase n=1 Tax=Granulicella rosea TaxID=474952 RepID=A0A239D8H6_9BACT|nr:putative Ig domain-containing protein [Granulicella rosea]SNS28816.1 hypothetical protein SAMN05421770_101351 [Granulicella rosea]